MAQRDETNGRMLARGALALGALGVVFGDIVTSPLYTVQTLFNPHDPHPISADAAEHFRLPRDQTVIMGSRIEL